MNRDLYERMVMWIGYCVGQRYERRIIETRDPLKKLSRIKKLAAFYAKNYSGVLVSKVLEDCLLEMAEKLPAYAESIVPRHLHVASELYDTGGHTRMIFNWVQNDHSAPHDLVLLRHSRVPEWLREAVKHSGGKIYDYSCEKDDFARAKSLKKLASTYLDVTLHTHMDDITPILAFGSTFSRPVRIFNHADQLFWLGVSIADQVFELNSYGASVTKKYRGLDNSYVLPIVLSEDLCEWKADKKKVRQALGVPDSHTLLVSMASPYKFKGRSGVFFKQAPKMLKDNMTLVLIGPTTKGAFKRLAQKYPGKILIVGPKNKDDANDILAAADLYVDSYPVGSFTCMLQAVMVDTPVVTAFPASTPDILLNSKVDGLPSIRDLDLSCLSEKFLEPAKGLIWQHFGPGWSQILQSAPEIKKHHVKNIVDAGFNPCVYPAWVYFCNFSMRRYLGRILKLIF